MGARDCINPVTQRLSNLTPMGVISTECHHVCVTQPRHNQRAKARAWLAASLAGLCMVLTAVATDLTTEFVPESWEQHPMTLSTAVTVLFLAAAATAMARSRLSGQGDDPSTGSEASQRAVATSQAALASAPTAASQGPIRLNAPSNLPPRNPSFTGRSVLLEEVRQSLHEGPVAVVAVQGLGGVGKTQLALEASYRSLDRGEYDLVWWIRAESPLTLAQDVASMAPALNVQTDREQDRTVARVLACLRQRGRWLLVFDDARDADEIRRWLPTGTGHVLITSRHRSWSGLARSVRVSEFSLAESVSYLTRQDLAENAPARELAVTLGHLPLALAQAASYMERHQLSIVGYLKLYRNREASGRLLAAGLPGYAYSVATTWLIHFQELKNRHPAALELLQFCAFLDPDNINLEILLSSPTLFKRRRTQRLARTLTNPVARESVIATLASTGLVTREDDLRIRMHRLVGQVTRHQLCGGSRNSYSSWPAQVISVLAELFPGNAEYPQTWPICKDLAAHVMAVIEHGAKTKDSVTALSFLGRYLTGRAENNAAQKTFRLAVDIAGRVYGLRHVKFAAMLGNLGITEDNLGNTKRAHALQVRALAIKESIHGTNHPDVARTLGNLGLLEKALGDHETARATMNRTVKIFEQHFGKESRDVALALNNLGDLELEVGNQREAEDILLRALEVNKIVHPPDHPEVATTLHSLGLVRERMGQLSTARENLLCALAIREHAYGPNHPQVTLTLASLGRVHSRLGDIETAQEYERRVLAAAKEQDGPECPETHLIKERLESIASAHPSDDQISIQAEEEISHIPKEPRNNP